LTVPKKERLKNEKTWGKRKIRYREREREKRERFDRADTLETLSLETVQDCGLV